MEAVWNALKNINHSRIAERNFYLAILELLENQGSDFLSINLGVDMEKDKLTR